MSPCPAANTYRSLLDGDRVLHIIPEYGSAVPALEDHAVLISALSLFKPVAQVSLKDNAWQISAPDAATADKLVRSFSYVIDSRFEYIFPF